MSNTMTKQEFHDNFMSLLSEELGIKSYFNPTRQEFSHLNEVGGEMNCLF